MWLENQGRKWLTEDVINLVEMIHEGANWTTIAHTLGRSENACKLAYGKVRFASRIRTAMGYHHNWSKLKDRVTNS